MHIKMAGTLSLVIFMSYLISTNRGSRQKSIFSGHIFFLIFFELQKKFLFLSGPAFTPLPLLSGRATNKNNFFAASLTGIS